MTLIRLVTRQIVAEHGWKPGTSLQNNVALTLSRWGYGPEQVAQQYPIGKYRADFAHVAKGVVIEADG